MKMVCSSKWIWVNPCHRWSQTEPGQWLWSEEYGEQLHRVRAQSWTEWCCFINVPWWNLIRELRTEAADFQECSCIRLLWTKCTSGGTGCLCNAQSKLHFPNKSLFISFRGRDRSPSLPPFKVNYSCKLVCLGTCAEGASVSGCWWSSRKCPFPV